MYGRKPIDKVSEMVTSQKNCSDTCEISPSESMIILTKKKASLVSDLLEIQTQLGAKRMVKYDGSVMSLSEFTEARQKLKNALSWRQIAIIKIKNDILKIREKINTSKPKSNRSKMIGIAFSLICDDVASGKDMIFKSDADVAEYYIGKALNEIS